MKDFTPLNTPYKYICDTCDFKCCKNSDWLRHLSTAKHKRLINPKHNTPIYANKVYQCDCGKVYKHMSSLCAHKKKCTNLIESENNEYMYQGINIKDKDALVLHLLKQN
jgi:phenolic acid decarboxylase